MANLIEELKILVIYIKGVPDSSQIESFGNPNRLEARVSEPTQRLLEAARNGEQLQLKVRGNFINIRLQQFPDGEYAVVSA